MPQTGLSIPFVILLNFQQSNTGAMTTQIQKQKPSKKLEQLLADLGPDFSKLETKKDAIFEQGRKEGFSNMEIGDLVRSKMKEHYSDRTIRRLLPDTAKQQQDHSKQKADKMSASEREPIELPGDKVKVEDASGDISPEEQKLALQQYEDTVAKFKQQIDPVKFQQEQEQKSKLVEQPGPKEVQGIHNIAPEKFKIDELEEYDHDLLVGIVRYLHNKVQDRKIELLQKENATLKKENEQFKKLPNNDALYNRIDVLQKENARLNQQLQGPNTTAGVPKEPNQKQEWLLGK